ncbi:MAG: hypothetical protein HOW73_43420 [Polyangiaceae bacterium]|nr:hypothetical protein [Polyangiaceae bacterium]
MSGDATALLIVYGVGFAIALVGELSARLRRRFDESLVDIVYGCLVFAAFWPLFVGEES